MRQIHPQIKLILVVLRLHVSAELIEVLVVAFFLDVRQLVHSDHAQELVRHLFKQRRHADFALGFELVALHPRDLGVRAQGVRNHLQAVVKSHF